MYNLGKLLIRLILLNIRPHLRPNQWRAYSEFFVTLLFLFGLSGCGGGNGSVSLSSSSILSSDSSLSSSQPATTTSSSSAISLETSSSSIASLSSVSSVATSSSSSSLLNYNIAIAAGDDQTGLTGAALVDAISVKVTTAAGVAVANTTVNFAIAGGSGSVTPLSATTNEQGVATANVTLGATAGAVHITATPDASNSSVRFRMTSVEPDATANKSSTEFNSTWATASHTKVSPNYSEVFDQDSVKTLEITLTAAQWASVRADMTVIFGNDFGAGGMSGGGINGGGAPEGQQPGGTFPGGQLPEGGFPEGQIPGGGLPGGELPGGEIPEGGIPGGNGGALDLVDGDPAYVPVTISYNNKQWKKVGFRLKGNSSLSSAWGQGNYKLPFRLKTNEFEDLFTAVSGQRFYGFKDLSFSPGYSDASLIREKLGSDIFRAGGVPAARTAFYRVYIDFGEGKKYCGVYTLVEVIDDTMIKDQFGEDKGNVYKPESTFASFNESEFEKKNNTKTPDFSDVQSIITVLNSTARTSDPAKWRTDLEAVFNVEHFLKWLAINNAIVSWDSYGTMAHNYYLYNHSQTKLTWIPWDLNMSLTGSPGVEGATSTGGMGGGMGQGLSLSMNEVTNNWPLIRNLIDDEVYFAKYKAYLKAFNQGAFNQATIDALIDKYYGLITPYVIGESGEQTGYTYTTEVTFTAGQQELKTHILNRKALISGYLPE